MMEKKNMKKRYILLVILLLVQTGLLFVIFTKFKQGFHSDEVYNYGFANSVDFKDPDVGEGVMNSWQDGQRFRDYHQANGIS